MKLFEILKSAFTEQANGQAEPEKWITSPVPYIDDPEEGRVFKAYPEAEWKERVVERVKGRAEAINAEKARRKPAEDESADQGNEKAEPERWVASPAPSLGDPDNKVFNAYPEAEWEKRVKRAMDMATSINAEKARSEALKDLPEKDRRQKISDAFDRAKEIKLGKRQEAAASQEKKPELSKSAIDRARSLAESVNKSKSQVKTQDYTLER